MPKLIVTDREGATHELDGPVGWSVMEVIRENNLPVEAACGGCCACATCHVYVAEDWLPRLEAASSDEGMMLDEAFEGLAPVVVNRFIEAVMKIKAMGISILMAESHLASAARIGDRLYAIDRGEIIFHGAPKDAMADVKVVKALRG